jgi:CheY-like chemotaxis protein
MEIDSKPVMAPQPGRTRVLVVDDHADVADTLAELLDQVGCETRVAYDGASAIVSATEFHPDVVVLDLRLPDVSGDDVCKALRSMPGGATTRIIALTGRSRGAGPNDEACFDDYLIKPVGAATVLDMLMHGRTRTVPAGLT